MYLFQYKYVEIACESMESFINARIKTGRTEAKTFLASF